MSNGPSGHPLRFTEIEDTAPSDTNLDTDINNPSHYNKNGLETIDLLKESMSTEEFKGYLKGNLLKYVSRYQHKHPAEPKKDLLKAEWYLKRLIEEW